jgi:voltage-gated potassium channel
MNPQRWRGLTEWPLVMASALFLLAYAWEVIANLEPPWSNLAEVVIWISWVLFLIDYVVRFAIAGRGQRWKWFYSHILDLLVVVLPMLRPLRVLRLVTLLSVLQRTAGAAIRSRIVIYAGCAGTLLVFVAALAVLDAERGQPGSTIKTFWDALWWAFVTITTVGYGDFTPVSATGRLIAVGLMIGGIALLGVITATFASWIVQQVETADEERTATVGHLRALEAKIDELQVLLTRPDGPRAASDGKAPAAGPEGSYPQVESGADVG